MFPGPLAALHFVLTSFVARIAVSRLAGRMRHKMFDKMRDDKDPKESAIRFVSTVEACRVSCFFDGSDLTAWGR